MSAITKYFLTQTVAVIKVRGNINHLLVNQIQRQLMSINKNSVKALAIVVNSSGGCPYETNILGNKLKHYAHENHLPLYTFAEQKAISCGYQLLSYGDKVYIQPTSIVGQSGVVTSLLRAKHFLLDHGVNRYPISSNKNLLSNYTGFDQSSTEQGRRILSNHYNTLSGLIQQEIEQNRQSRLQIDGQELYSSLFIGRNALQKGLVDEIGSHEVILSKLYPSAKLISLTKELQKLEENFYFLLKLSQSRGFILLIAIILIKMIIKYTIILIIWRKMRKQKKQEQKQ